MRDSPDESQARMIFGFSTFTNEVAGIKSRSGQNVAIRCNPKVPEKRRDGSEARYAGISRPHANIFPADFDPQADIDGSRLLLCNVTSEPHSAEY
jgi:hypothetical protein